jgi:hypothetical protein
MTNDPDKLDEMVAQAARSYNAPTDVPREEMWNRIAEARRTQSAPARSTPRAPWTWSVVGLAAAGLVAIGVTIGRYVERGQRAPHSPSSETAKAPDASAPRESVRPAAVDVARGPRDGQAPTAQLGADPRAVSAVKGGGSDAATLTYRLAVVEHVAGSEAMITAFRGAARRGEIDPQMEKWSRDLLGETRLLEGSAPPDDVEMKRLLEDLELVLAQIVQYANRGTHSADDLDLIERSIKHRAVMTNMRTMSAGRLPSGT